MSSRSWQMRIQDILNAIAGIEQRTAGKTLEELQQDETLSKAILYDFMVIGEAARNVPAEIQSCYSKIPWRLMSDMRNIVAHEYFRLISKPFGKPLSRTYHCSFLSYRHY